jgi:hypothetical protein
MFEVICPGKSQLCGGRQNWLNALDEELRVFGKHRVRSTLVCGIEPKESLFEGLEYLSERGVVVETSQWNVNIGSPLEGHRTPNQDWHWEVFEKMAFLYRKHHFTWEEIISANASADSVAHDLFRLDAGILLEDTRKAELAKAS